MANGEKKDKPEFRARNAAGFILFLFFFFTGSFVSASMISVLVVEESGGAGGVERRESSFLWENGVLDVFFNFGYVVSNAPIAQIDHAAGKGLPREVRADFNEAASNGVDFFILVILDYRQGSGRGNEKPAAVSLRVFETKSAGILYEERVVPKNYRSKGEEIQGIKKLVENMVPRVKA